MTRRVVITGLGAVTPLSSEIPSLWRGLCNGQSGVSKIELFDTSDYAVHFGGEVKNFAPEKVLDKREVRRLDRFAQLAMVAAISAVKDCGIEFDKEDPFRCGVSFGSGIGGITEFEEQHQRFMEKGPSRVSPFVIPKMIANAAAGNISIQFGLAGHNSVISTACASAAQCIVEAVRTIQWGYADVMLAGASEAGITRMGLSGFCSARALSERNSDPAGASRPWDKDRDGFVLGEGAGVVVLEEYERARRRGANIYGEMLGGGVTADAHHITAPHPEGAGAAMAMKFALQDAKLNPEDIGYINAHGTSTQLGDEAETKAIKQAFGAHASRVPISSSKSMLGHLLGASGAVELMAAALTIKHGVIHPTINYQTPDPACDLDYVPNTAREARVRYAMSNSFGFGGHDCTLIVGAV